jgi:tryptophanyl-tRNA synthetase
MHNLRLFVAAGLPLEDENIKLYRQSYVPAHSELTVILNSFASFGQLTRMTQFKDKTKALLTDEEGNPYVDEKGNNYTSGYDAKGSNVSAGLFDYPVLMAADILLYGAKYVPVGDDQTQHLEFTRDISERMNSKFGELFVVPEPVQKQHEFFGKDQGLRIKDLQNPSRKMSKSEESDKGVIFLGDDPEEAAKKVMSAATDSVGTVHYDLENQPGISNLLQIHALLAGETLDAVIKEHDGQESYGDLKKEVADQVKEFLTEFQAKLAQVDDAQIMTKLQSSEAQMRDVANKTLLEVQKAIGLR